MNTGDHPHYPGEPILLTCDNLQTHINNPDIIRMLREKNIYLFTFVPNMTHKMQPNDLHINSTFNTIFATKMSMLETASRSLNSKTTLEDAIRTAITSIKSVKPSVVINSFKEAGVYSPQPNIVDEWKAEGLFTYREYQEENEASEIPPTNLAAVVKEAFENSRLVTYKSSQDDRVKA
jgi:hypothetical protein